MKRRSTLRDPSSYADAVVACLAAAFPRLEDTASIDHAVITQAISRHAAAPDPAFECIIDSPTLANWRLRADRARPGHVLVRCWKTTPSPKDNEREDQINAALSRLP